MAPTDFGAENDPTTQALEMLDAFEVLDHLTSLVEKSLVAVEEHEDGTFRYRLLHTVRQFSLDSVQLSGRLPALQQRHAAYFLDLAELAEPHIQGPEAAFWLNTLDANQENFLAVFDWCEHHSDRAVLALRLGAALARFWDARGHLEVGRMLIERALAVPSPDLGAALKARAHHAAGVLAFGQANYDVSGRHLGEALDLYREAENARGQADALNGLGLISWSRGDYASARDRISEALAIARKTGYRQMEGKTLNNLGLLAADLGDNSVARRLYEEALQINRELGNRTFEALFLSNLGELERRSGEPEKAVKLFEEAVAVSRELGDPADEANALTYLGLASLDLGQFARAAECFATGILLQRDAGDRLGVTVSLRSIAQLAHKMGDTTLMTRSLAVSERLREETGYSLPPSELEELAAQLHMARTTLGQAQFERVWGQGQDVSWEAAVTETVARLRRLSSSGPNPDENRV